MAQSINIKIAEKSYNLKASTPQQEQFMRIASEGINKKLSGYDSKYTGMEMVDKLAFVALNEAVSRIAYQTKLAELEKEIQALKAQTSSYLDNIER